MTGRHGTITGAYSLDASAYEPRCASCHKLYDRAAAF